MTIYFCEPHFLELVQRWGGKEAIERTYGEVIIDATKCENFQCISERALRCPHCNKPVKPSELIFV